VADRDAKVCASCGAKLPSRGWQVLERIGVSTPKVISMSGLLGLACAVVYARLVVANEGGSAFSFPTYLLREHGGHYTAAVANGDWWRWATAVFLHAGLWHIGFNLFALSMVGPHIERLYGSLVMVFVYMATGVLANIGSGAMGLPGIGIGASGAIMGLIGATAASAHRDGTSAGRALRNDMLKWTAYVMVFGFAIGADNWAHAYGFLAGGVFGYAVRPQWLKERAIRPLVAIVGALSLVAAAATTYATLDPPASEYERRLVHEFELELRPQLEPFIEQCEDENAEADPNCIELADMRRKCSHGIYGFVAREIGPEGRAHATALCKIIGEDR
jgi:membrane associated rhomboid family serine protease